MDVDEINARVAKIAQAAIGDPESAHADEDELWRDVLGAIADGADQPEELARAALKSWDLDHERWYA